MKTIVVYYSRTGRTRFVAERIAQLLNAELSEVVDKKNREGKMGFLIGGKDAMTEKLTEIETSKPIEEYDCIIVGSPVWADKIAPAIRKFFVSNTFVEKTVGLFVTLDGNKPEKALRNMKAAVSAKNIVGEAGFIRVFDDKMEATEKIKVWCGQIQKSLDLG